MSWIQTYSGEVFSPEYPTEDTINLEDIAHALSMICRFNGHCAQFYSVAEHSVYVSRFVSLELAMWGLMHDAAEAYISDLARPVKPMVQGFDCLELEIMKSIKGVFNLEGDVPQKVKDADLRMLATERKQLMGKADRDWETKP